jgi:hypothetical protein
MRTLIFIYVLMSACTITAHAQTLAIQSDSIIWTTNKFKDVQASEEIDFVCQFITRGIAEDILWSQKNGDHVTSFVIKGSSLNWNDISKAGFVEFDVLYENQPGKFWIGRSDTGIEVRVSFIEENKSVMRYIFNISDYVKE